MANKPRKRAAATVGQAIPWSPPLTTAPLSQRVGSSILDDFVAGHSAADVFREIVQNEFDGGGSAIEILFGETELVITGTGRPISQQGWSRLSVIAGTGNVIGGQAGDMVEAKSNGIGSKNFGIRSLFLFGDRIHVRSNERVALLDFEDMGTDNLPDPSSAGRVGVSIHIPYRNVQTRVLEPFTVESERLAMTEIARALLPTLVKLASAGKSPGIRRLTAASARTGRRLEWRQSARVESCPVKGVTAVRRTGRLEDWADQATTRPVVQKIEELEFTRTIPIPADSRHIDYPDYYRAGPTSLKVSISLPLRRNRIDFDQVGHFHYPLQTPQSRTGSTVQVSAPFKLDNDRSSLLVNSWNVWLQEAAALLTRSLVRQDWFDRFGADAYLALDATAPASPVHYGEMIREGMKAEACWPTMEAGRRPVFAKASDIVVAADSVLERFLTAGQYLEPGLLKVARVAEMARDAGAKRFTVNSLVTLRCGAPGAKLATVLAADEANYHYPDYASSAAEPDAQRRSAAALTTLRRYLSKENKRDLETTASTLTAAGSLAPASGLTKVEAANWQDCPEPMASRLDQGLNEATSVSRYCKAFDLARWVTDACQRAQAGTIDPGERQAVHRWLLQPSIKLNSRLLALVRRAPVVKDRQGEWVAPVDLAMLPARDAALLGDAVHAPASELARRSDLLRRLNVRRKVTAPDLLALAERVAASPDRAEPFEELLGRHSALLRPALVKALAGTPCLRSRSGAIAAPEDLHLATVSNIEWLDDDARIVGGSAVSLYRKLGCLSEPRADTLYAALAERRAANAPPPRPEDFYPALVEALKAEGAAVSRWSTEPILYLGGSYHAPEDCLVLQGSARLFSAALPVHRGSEAVARAFESLGASNVARPRHWLALFGWFQDRAAAHGGVLTRSEQTALREAYRRHLFHPALEVPADLRFLLSTTGRLFSQTDLAAHRLVENDYPALADGLEAIHAPMAFGDLDEHSRTMLRRYGVHRLTEIADAPKVEPGSAKAPAPWLARACTDRLTLLHRPDFAIALAELGYAQRRYDPAFKSAPTPRVLQKLAAVTGIDIVNDIRLTYRLAGKTVRIPADGAVIKDRIVIVAPRSSVDFDQICAAVLAEFIGAVQLKDIRLLAPSIGALLHCRYAADFRSFLVRQGIPLPYALRDTGDNGQDDLFDGDARLDDAFRDIMGAMDTRSEPRAAPPPPPTPAPAPVTAPPVTPPRPLPPIDTVSLTEMTVTGQAPPVPPPSSSAGGWGGSGGWTPPTPEDAARDRLVGTRGEELVYRLELERVRAMGHEAPETVVIWRSRTQPGADHDIQSIDEKGDPLWIEVKATTGRDGRFDWSRAEYELAMREGARYELVRVYEANTNHPSAKRFRNPAALYGKGLRLELNTLRAFVESRS
jgi:hypothetical protein